MASLPLAEQLLFYAAMLLYLLAGVLGLAGIRTGRKDYPRTMIHLVSLAVIVEAILLVFRAVDLRAFPLTGPFESMVFLTIAFAALFLVLGIVLRQVWFAAGMCWTILLMLVLTVILTQPANEPHPLVAKPWAIAHGLTMIAGEGMIFLAAVSAVLYLIADRRLKQKKINSVLGMVPNLQTLGRLNRVGLLAGFVLVSLGQISGMGMVCIGAEHFGGNMTVWIRDWRVLSIVAAWGLIGYCLIGQYYGWFGNRLNAWLTVGSLGLISIVLICPVES